MGIKKNKKKWKQINHLWIQITIEELP